MHETTLTSFGTGPNHISATRQAVTLTAQDDVHAEQELDAERTVMLAPKRERSDQNRTGGSCRTR